MIQYSASEPAPLERVFVVLMRAHPKSYRKVYGRDHLLQYRDQCLEIRGAGATALIELWLGVVLPGIIKEAAEERYEQITGSSVYFSLSHRLAILGGLSAIIVGLGSFSDGVMAWASMQLFLSHPDLPVSVPFNFLEWPIMVGLLSTAGCAGLYALLNRRSRLATFGMNLAFASAFLTLFLGLYDWAFDPAYYSGGGFGLEESVEVDYLALALRQIGSWTLAGAVVSMAGAALGTARMRMWWPLLLAFGVVQSPLLSHGVRYLFVQSMGLELPLEWSLLVFEIQRLLFYIPLLLPGLAWLLLGCLLVTKAWGLWRKRSGTTGDYRGLRR